MSGFHYKTGSLHAEEVPLSSIAEQVGTPFYCYSTAVMAETYLAFAQALNGLNALICYALKANGNLGVVKTLAALGAGGDVVSEGELRRALQAGIPPEKVVFAGVGKTQAEMATALKAGILQFNVESFGELERLNGVAESLGRSAAVALRINPDVDARTHAKISTGKAENKFGIDLAQADQAIRLTQDLPALRLEGLAVHIGSQLTELTPFENAFSRVTALFGELRAAGHGLKRLDFGGGLGIPYQEETPPTLEAYVEVVRRATADLRSDGEVQLVFEPGRLLVGNAGILVTKVLYTKQGTEKRFLVVDAAMNDLIRPTLYDAWHAMIPVTEPRSDAAALPLDVVGPICESGDTFAKDRLLPPFEEADLLAICSTGAYGAVMASAYNMRPPAPEVLVKGGDFAVVRSRQTYEELLNQDHVPSWLENDPSEERSDVVSRGAA